MGDYNSETGVKHGEADAESGRGKSIFVRPIKRLLQINSFLPGGENRIDSYLNGYSMGYSDRIRILRTKAETSKCGLDNTNSNIRGEMTKSNSLEYQLELLQELNTYIKSVQEQLDAMRFEYGRRVNDLRDAGLLYEHHEFLQRNIFNPTESALLKFIEHLQVRDLDTVRREIGFVEAELERLRSYDSD